MVFNPTVLDLDPIRVNGLLLGTWANRVHDINKDLGHPDRRSDLAPLNTAIAFAAAPRFRWHHLIYAYMIENTRAWEIMRRVVFEYLHGEKLGAPLATAQAWLRTTEELFFDHPLPLGAMTVVSYLRPSDAINRSSVYRRMFGMELNHGTEDGKPYGVVKADASNLTFVATFEELLREVWVAMSYFKASASADLTDPSKIQSLIQKLHDMLLSRRQNGNLAREEFAYVTTMEWFHLTLSANTSIVQSMRAEATGIEQRLFKIAERVGMPAHGLSRSFLDIAEPISRLLIDIEAGSYNTVPSVAALYTPGSSTEADMRTILTHWATIRNIKAWK
jgi:hypothetical protein